MIAVFVLQREADYDTDLQKWASHLVFTEMEMATTRLPLWFYLEVVLDRLRRAGVPTTGTWDIGAFAA